MAEGFLAFVDKTELEIDAKPEVEVISKRTSTRYLDVKHESDDKKKDKKKEKEHSNAKPSSDLPGVPKDEKVKGFLDFIDEEDPNEKIEIVAIRRAPSTTQLAGSSAVGFLGFVEEGKHEKPPEVQKITSKNSSRNVSRKTSRQSVDPTNSMREEEYSTESQRSTTSMKSDKLKKKKSKKDKLK